jgi:hypothetical protein
MGGTPILGDGDPDLGTIAGRTGPDPYLGLWYSGDPILGNLILFRVCKILLLHKFGVSNFDFDSKSKLESVLSVTKDHCSGKGLKIWLEN